jgi:hypothetical protein
VRYGAKFPAKIVAWNHVNGSGLTVLPEIQKVQDLGGKTVAIPFWYSIHIFLERKRWEQDENKKIYGRDDSICFLSIGVRSMFTR